MSRSSATGVCGRLEEVDTLTRFSRRSAIRHVQASNFTSDTSTAVRTRNPKFLELICAFRRSRKRPILHQSQRVLPAVFAEEIHPPICIQRIRCGRARSPTCPTRSRADSPVGRLASSNRSATPRVSMSAFAISAAAPAVAPAKARVARTGIKARAAPVRRSVRAAATAEASADTAASASGVRVCPSVSTSLHHVSTRVGPASQRASIDHRDRRSSGVVACRPRRTKHAAERFAGRTNCRHDALSTRPSARTSSFKPTRDKRGFFRADRHIGRRTRADEPSPPIPSCLENTKNSRPRSFTFASPTRISC